MSFEEIIPKNDEEFEKRSPRKSIQHDIYHEEKRPSAEEISGRADDLIENIKKKCILTGEDTDYWWDSEAFKIMLELLREEARGEKVDWNDKKYFLGYTRGDFHELIIELKSRARDDFEILKQKRKILERVDKREKDENREKEIQERERREKENRERESREEQSRERERREEFIKMDAEDLIKQLKEMAKSFEEKWWITAEDQTEAAESRDGNWISENFRVRGINSEDKEKVLEIVKSQAEQDKQKELLKRERIILSNAEEFINIAHWKAGSEKWWKSEFFIQKLGKLKSLAEGRHDGKYIEWEDGLFEDFESEDYKRVVEIIMEAVSKEKKESSSEKEEKFVDRKEKGENYEKVEKFAMTKEAIIGKKVSIVEPDIDVNRLMQIINFKHQKYDKYTVEREGMKLDIKMALKVEGIPGILIALSRSSDEFRSNFGGWINLPNVDGKIIKDLGVADGFSESSYDREREYNYDEEGDKVDKTEIKIGNSMITFGTSYQEDYYPYGFCNVEIDGKKQRDINKYLLNIDDSWHEDYEEFVDDDDE